MKTCKQKAHALIIVTLVAALLLTGCASLGIGFKSKAKDFTLPDLEGDMIALSDYRGQNVFLNFWASWCEPCVDEMPDIEKIYQTYQDQGLVVLTINTGEDKTTVTEFMQQHGYTFPVLLDLNLNTARQYKTTSIPVSFFINKDGKIAAKKVGLITAEEIKQQLDKLK